MKNLFRNWNAERIIRSIVALGVIAYAITFKDFNILIMGGMFFIQTILNVTDFDIQNWESQNKESQTEVI